MEYNNRQGGVYEIYVLAETCDIESKYVYGGHNKNYYNGKTPELSFDGVVAVKD